MQTNELIQCLAVDILPVKRLPAPWLRTALWLAISIPYVVAIVAMHSAAADLVGGIDTRFALEQTAILATALTAAIAAFSSVVPGHDRRIYYLPLLPLLLWLASLGEGCAQDWIRFGASGLQLRPDWECARAAIFIGMLPAVAMVVMLRRGAPLIPRATVAFGALAVAALGNFGLRIFHIGDVSIMVLAWHFGSLAVISILVGRVGHRILNWRSVVVSAVPRRLLQQ